MTTSVEVMGKNQNLQYSNKTLNPKQIEGNL